MLRISQMQQAGYPYQFRVQQLLLHLQYHHWSLLSQDRHQQLHPSSTGQVGLHLSPRFLQVCRSSVNQSSTPVPHALQQGDYHSSHTHPSVLVEITMVVMHMHLEEEAEE